MLSSQRPLWFFHLFHALPAIRTESSGPCLSLFHMRCMMTEKQSTSKYIIDIEDGSETARLIAQDAFVTRSMGGVFPSHYTPEPGSRILDIACGPGGWVLDVAFAHPDIKIVG